MFRVWFPLIDVMLRICFLPFVIIDGTMVNYYQFLLLFPAVRWKKESKRKKRITTKQNKRKSKLNKYRNQATEFHHIVQIKKLYISLFESIETTIAQLQRKTNNKKRTNQLVKNGKTGKKHIDLKFIVRFKWNNLNILSQNIIISIVLME